MKRSKKLLATMLAMSMALPNGMIAQAKDATVTSWADLYSSLGVQATTDTGMYDVVTSATSFSSYHAKDIPAIVNRVTDAEGKTTGLDGIVLSGVEATKPVRLSSATYAYTSRYGISQFNIVPDDTVEGYVWNEYFSKLYAVTISDGITTVGCMPWIDYYGESATSGPHYNKVEIALNSGDALASNKAYVSRFDALMDEDGNLNPGTYTVTLYSEGYQPLVAEQIQVKAVSGVSLSAEDVSFGAENVAVEGLHKMPADFKAVYTVDGTVQTLKAEGDVNTITLPANLAVGSHTITISDQSGVYTDISATFMVTTDKVMAQYDVAQQKLVKADDVTDEEFASYLKAITSVSVNGTAYSASGRGATVIIGADGTIDLEAKEGTVFNDNTLNEMIVTATAYTNNLTVAVQKGNVPAIMIHGEYITKVEAKKPTGRVEGNVEYYICSDCGRCWSDAELTNEIDQVSTIIAKVALKAQPMTASASKTKLTGSAVYKAAQKVTLKVKDAKGKVSYKVSNSKYMTVKSGVVTFAKKTPAGTYKITVTAAGDEYYKSGSKVITVKVVKSAQPMKLGLSSKSYKTSVLKKASKSFTIKTKDVQGKLTFKSSNTKRVTVTSKGKVTVKKGTPKGTYKITVKAAGNKWFENGSETVTIKVK